MLQKEGPHHRAVLCEKDADEGGLRERNSIGALRAWEREVAGEKDAEEMGLRERNSIGASCIASWERSGGGASWDIKSRRGSRERIAQRRSVGDRWRERGEERRIGSEGNGFSNETLFCCKKNNKFLFSNKSDFVSEPDACFGNKNQILFAVSLHNVDSWERGGGREERRGEDG
ncbi:unnamed protein product [Victoria cruziana]